LPFYYNNNFFSCCVDEVAAQHVSGDSIIHFGHACLSPVTLSSVLYVLPKATINVSKFYNELKTIDLIGPILILYDVSFAHLLGLYYNYSLL
jgi:diphthamide biosynthesis protein 2